MIPRQHVDFAHFDFELDSISLQGYSSATLTVMVMLFVSG